MKKGEQLKNLRAGIDLIDRELIRLLNARAEKVLDVCRQKEKDGIPHFDPSRERLMVEKLQRLNPGPLGEKDIDIFMQAMFHIYRSFGRPLNIAYFGPAGTNTHQASLRRFGEKHHYVPCKTVEYVFKEVERGQADYGVVPIENSSEGAVSHTLDMFVESDVKITAEILLRVHHCLLSRETGLSAIRKIYSHPQALNQCYRWIEAHLPQAEVFETESTASAAAKVRTEKHAASINPEIASRIYGLNILAEKIEDHRENITRFVVIGRNVPAPTGHDKTSILLAVKDKVGALYDILLPFKAGELNMTRIESRPNKKKAWEYIFFIDFHGHRDDPAVERVLKRLGKHCVLIKVLGSYPIDG